MISYVLTAVNTIIFLILVIAILRSLKVVIYFVRISQGISLDREVDRWFEKAAVISYIMHRESKKTPQEKYTTIIERTCAIVADVMLQHGQNPKNYNLQGLAELALYKTGITKIIESLNLKQKEVK